MEHCHHVGWLHPQCHMAVIELAEAYEPIGWLVSSQFSFHLISFPIFRISPVFYFSDLLGGSGSGYGIGWLGWFIHIFFEGFLLISTQCFHFTFSFVILCGVEGARLGLASHKHQAPSIPYIQHIHSFTSRNTLFSCSEYL